MCAPSEARLQRHPRTRQFASDSRCRRRCLFFAGAHPSLCRCSLWRILLAPRYRIGDFRAMGPRVARQGTKATGMWQSGEPNPFTGWAARRESLLHTPCLHFVFYLVLKRPIQSGRRPFARLGKRPSHRTQKETSLTAQHANETRIRFRLSGDARNVFARLR